MRSDDSTAPTEESIRDRFEAAVLAAEAGRLAHWELSAMPFVALVILLDQFPRTSVLPFLSFIRCHGLLRQSDCILTSVPCS